MAKSASGYSGGTFRTEPTSMANLAEGRQAADLFEYSIPTPVTVKKNESAMLPFLQQPITAKKLIIYAAHRSPNPLTAAEITNTTKFTLDGGPITVYDSGVYAGEALMETLKINDKRLISYGVDLGTRVTTAFDSGTDIVREIHMRHGMLAVKTSRVETTTYTVRNIDSKDKTLIIEQQVQPQTSVVRPATIEKTATAWRFELNLPANSPATLPVVLERIYDQTYAVANMTPEAIVMWSQNKALSAAARRDLEQLNDLKNQLAAVTSEITSNETEVAAVTRDEDRARQNISSLNSVSGQQQQVQTYARQLAELESKITALRDRRAELEKRKTTLQAQINSALEKISF